jgi:hypothetical protein
MLSCINNGELARGGGGWVAAAATVRVGASRADDDRAGSVIVVKLRIGPTVVEVVLNSE